jgi:hypothetical protein
MSDAKPKKNPPGRPSKFSDALADEICELLMSGMPLTQICRDPKFPDSVTVYRWLEKHEAFRNKYRSARDVQAEHYLDKIIEVASDSRNDWVEVEDARGNVRTVLDSDHVQRSRLICDNLKWVMSRIAPKKYGDKIQADVAHSGEVKVEIIKNW